jgi:hypothetical protein
MLGQFLVVSFLFQGPLMGWELIYIGLCIGCHEALEELVVNREILFRLKPNVGRGCGRE